MNSRTLLILGLLASLPVTAQQAESQQQATITGERGPGHCTLELEVDGTAEVYVRDQIASVRTLSGRPSVWRRFQCNQPLPRNPDGFQMRMNHGRGDARLIHDPVRGGVATVRIDDPKGGSDRYEFTLEWRADGGSYPQGGGYPQAGYPQTGPKDGDRDRDRDRDRNDRGMGRERMARMCSDAVADRLRRDGYGEVQITGANIEDRPGRRDRVLGRAIARENWGSEEFAFSCGVDFSSGAIRSVDVVPR